MNTDAMDSKELLPGLPAEIAGECLLRVPYQHHPNLKSVCHGWETLLKSPSFYKERKNSGRAEQCICMVQALIPQGSDKPRCPPEYALTVYNTLEDSWSRLTDIRHFPNGIPLFCQCVSVNEKLFVIGGWDPVSLQAISRVSIYDFSRRKWSRGADMSTVRAFFACAVHGGEIFVSGGHDDGKNALKSGEVYSVDEDKWERIPDMSQERDEPQGAFVDGKFFVISGYTTEAQGRFDNSAEVYDAADNRWTRLDDMWAFAGCPSSCISASGKLVCFRGKQMMEYGARENSWNAVGDVPESVSVGPRATVLNDGKIFVSGSGCGGGGEQVALLLQPALPSPENGDANQGRRRGASIALNSPHGFCGFVYSVCRVEI